MSRSVSSRVSTDRITRADIRPGAGRPVTGYLGDEAHLAPIRLGDDMPQDAARAIARHTMLGAHGCTGKGCRKRAHKPDRAVRDELLEMLQLKPGG